MADTKPKTTRSKKAAVKKTKAIKPKKTENLESEMNASDITSTDSGRKINFRSKTSISLILGALILALLAYFGVKYFVVAWVDKKPITRFEYYQNLESRYGKDTKEQMITEKLILDEAQGKGVSVSDKEIQDEINKFVAQQGGQAQLDQILQMQGLNMDQLKRLVRLQLLRQKLFGNNITVSDQELSQYIEQNKQSLLPDKDQLATDSANPEISDAQKAQIKDQLKQQKINDAFQTWLTQTLQSSRVQRN
jgi:parvulin-like peptidyl-prolyl isomerase